MSEEAPKRGREPRGIGSPERTRLLARKRYARHRFKERLRKAAMIDALKRQAIMKLGGKCVVDGIAELDVLEIDHIVPIKQAVRRGSGTTWYNAILKDRTDVSNLQVLCANCHRRKTRYERRNEVREYEQ